MGVINFIIENILIQASITIALIAMLGLILQKKSTGQIISGTIENSSRLPSIKCGFQHLLSVV